jgi:Ca2+-dependent lipid-binding protein
MSEPDPDTGPIFRTKAAIRDPEPNYGDRFDVEIDAWVPKDARLVFEVKDRRRDSPLDDETVGMASIKLSSIKPNVKKDVWLPLKSVEGGFQLDRDAGVRVDLLLRPDDSEGDFVDEKSGLASKMAQHSSPQGTTPVKSEKTLMKEENGGNSVGALIKTLGRKVARGAGTVGGFRISIFVYDSY